jgi:hypothetical protein
MICSDIVVLNWTASFSRKGNLGRKIFKPVEQKEFGSNEAMTPAHLRSCILNMFVCLQIQICIDESLNIKHIAKFNLTVKVVYMYPSANFFEVHLEFFRSPCSKV